jgi:N-dimethylarginine dimethylaminohydrolase
MKKVLLCPPTHYRVEYAINPWMDIKNKVDLDKARKEYENLKQAYKELGVEVLETEQDKDQPDMVYAANCGFPQGNTFIKSNFKHEERRKEAELAKQYFQKLGYEIKELPENVVWEGQGDLIVVGEKYFLGWGKRTDYEAKKYLSEFLGKEIIDFKMIDPYYYHLDTCFLPLDENTVAINPKSFEPEGLEKIHQIFQNVIEVGESDNKILACNSVIVDKTILSPSGISQQLKDGYAKYGYSVREIQMGEFLKGGGSIKCLTLEFYEKPRVSEAVIPANAGIQEIHIVPSSS